MGDSYQAIYDAVRSKIGAVSTDEVIGNAVRDAFDMSHARALLQEQIVAVGHELTRPSAIYRPRVYPDGNMWCALYGENLQEGVTGFGESPEKAMAAFDAAWYQERK